MENETNVLCSVALSDLLCSTFTIRSDADGGQVVESLPSGASAKDFEPRAIGTGTKVRVGDRRLWLLFFLSRGLS